MDPHHHDVLGGTLVSALLLIILEEGGCSTMMERLCGPQGCSAPYPFAPLSSGPVCIRMMRDNYGKEGRLY